VRNYDDVRSLVTERVRRSRVRISAKRLLQAARAAGYAGSARNFRRLVAEVKAGWRAGHHRGRRPAVWTPGDTLVIDWGSQGGGLHVFRAVLAWSRVRFGRFAADEKAATTLRLLAEWLANTSRRSEFRRRCLRPAPAVISVRTGSRGRPGQTLLPCPGLCTCSADRAPHIASAQRLAYP
jgi:hypothetical protein